MIFIIKKTGVKMSPKHCRAGFLLLGFICRLGHFWQSRNRQRGRSCPTEGRTSGKAGGSEKKGKWVSGLKGGTVTAIGDMQPGREGSEREDGGGGGREGKGFLN